MSNTMDRDTEKILFLLTLLAFFGTSFAFLELNLQQCEQLEGDKEFVDAYSLKVKKLNKTTRGLDGPAVIKVPLDENYEVAAKVFLKQGGEYRLMPYKLPKMNLCKAAMEDTYFYPDLAAASHFPTPFECPLPAKTYNIESFVPSLDKVPSAILQSGDYALELIVSLNDEDLLKWKVWASVINI